MGKNRRDESNSADTTKYTFKAVRGIKKLGLREGATQEDETEKYRSFQPNKRTESLQKPGKDAAFQPGRTVTGESRQKPGGVPSGVIKDETHHKAANPGKMTVPGKGTANHAVTFMPYASSSAAGTAETAARTSAGAARKAASAASKEIAGAAGKSNAATAAAQAATKGFKKIAEAARSTSESSEPKSGNGLKMMIALIATVLLLAFLPVLLIVQATDLLGLSAGEITETDLSGIVHDENAENLSDADAVPTQRRIAERALVEPTTAPGWCAQWVINVYAVCGYSGFGGNANEMWARCCYSNNRNELQVGMVVAVQHSGPTGDSWLYGHVGIYIGGNKVIHSTGTIQINTLEEWIAAFDPYNTIRWGFPPGVKEAVEQERRNQADNTTKPGEKVPRPRMDGKE